MAGGDNPIDDDILQSKQDILRASDLVPPYGPKETTRPTEIAKTEPIDSRPTKKVRIPTFEEIQAKANQRKPATIEIKSIEPKPAEPDSTQLEEIEKNEKPENVIPEFNLANQILSEQRKISSAKRKGPGSKTPPTPPRSSEEAKPISDIRSSREYRQELSKVLVRQALNM